MSTTYSNYLAALTRVRAGTGDAKILIVGDSTSWGKGGGGSNPPITGSYPAKLVALMNASGLPTTFGLNNYSNPNPADLRWTLGNGWETSNIAGFGDSCVRGVSGASGSVSFAPGYTCDRADIYYVQNNLGTSTVSVDGGSSTALPTVGTAGITKTTISFAANSSPVLTFTGPTGGDFYLYGIDCYSSTVRHVRVSITGASGTTSAQWADNSAVYTSQNCIATYAPDLTIVMLGINDAGYFSPGTLSANLQAIVTTAQISGDVVLCSIVPSQDGDGRYTVEQSYYPGYSALASSAGCAYADVWQAFGGAYQVAKMSDSLHPNDDGYALIAQTVYNVLPVPVAPVITSPATATATVGQAFSYQIAANGSPTSYGASGLPRGLTLNTTTGIISGVLSSISSTIVSISATNTSGTGNAELNLTVLSPMPAPIITSKEEAQATATQPFQYQIEAENDATSYSVNVLPTGLSLNPNSGLISGTPTVAASSVITLTATNQFGSGTSRLELKVNASPTGFGVTVTKNNVVFFAQVAASTVSTTLLGENGNRVATMLYNKSTSNLYVLVGGVATLTNFSFIIPANSLYEMFSSYYTDSLSGIWDATDGSGYVNITEVSNSTLSVFNSGRFPY